MKNKFIAFQTYLMSFRRLYEKFFVKNTFSKTPKMTDKFVIRSPKPFYDIPDISVPELIHNLLSKLDGQSICTVSHKSIKSELLISG